MDVENPPPYSSTGENPPSYSVTEENNNFGESIYCFITCLQLICSNSVINSNNDDYDSPKKCMILSMFVVSFLIIFIIFFT
jgi:hypothetical protein